MIIWISGNSKSGKSTLAKQMKPHKNCVIIDGDDIREIYPTGFSLQERRMHNLNMARLADKFHKQGNDVIVASICPEKQTRDYLEKEFNIGFIYLSGGLSGPEFPYEYEENKFYFQKKQ